MAKNSSTGEPVNQAPTPAVNEAAPAIPLQAFKGLETVAALANSRVASLAISKTGVPCLWENGGGCTNTGTAQIIADGLGYPKRAICVRTHGDRACGDHALIPVRAGDHVVTVDRHHDKVAIRVERIASINGNSAELVPETAPICVDAINAAVAKSNDYHCRTPYYIR